MDVCQLADLITDGVPEQPLETADQLQPGVIISGIAAQHCWMILDRQAEDLAGWIRLRQLQRGVQSHTHAWTVRGEGAKDCDTCGLRLQRMADLLPLTTPRARVIIPPAGVLNALDQLTLYATTSGAVVTVSGTRSTRVWSSALPIIPSLAPIWTLPEALRACLRPAEAAALAAEVGAEIVVDAGDE